MLHTIKQSIKAINAYLESLPLGLSGKKKAAALAKQKKWTVSVAGWEMIDQMIKVLGVRVYFTF